MTLHPNACLALAAGLIGGLLSHYLTLPSALAQTPAPDPVEIRAQRYSFVDERGRALGSLALQQGRIVLRDASGREIWSAGAMAIPRPIAQK